MAHKGSVASRGGERELLKIHVFEYLLHSPISITGKRPVSTKFSGLNPPVSSQQEILGFFKKKTFSFFHFLAFGLATPGPVLACRMDPCGTWVYLAARSTPSELRDILVTVRRPEESP